MYVDKTTYMLWKIVAACWHAEGLNENDNRTSLSTWDTGYDPSPAHLVQSQGAWVIDARCIAENMAIQMALNGPMVDVLLPDGHVRSACCETRLARENEEYTPLQFVALDLYVANWAKLPEVRIGRVKGRKVIWQDRGCKPIL
jgi:hypothetical protein